MTQGSETLAEGIRRRYKLGRDRLRGAKRQLLRFSREPRLAIRYAAYRRAIRRHDWAAAEGLAREVAELALGCRDRRLLQEMMHALQRFECFEEAARAHRAWREALADGPRNPWRGEDLAGKTLMVDLTEKHEHGLGVALHGANFAAKAARLAARVIIVVEPRLVPLYRRSFSGLDIRDRRPGPEDEAADFVATLGDLSGAFIPRKGLSDPDFHPLVADPERVAELRAKYQGGEKIPLIGLFWYSSHHGKDIPALAEWRSFIANTDARFVSLQYGDVTGDVRFLGADRVIHDPSIDQMTDMDAFAAQVAALDAVVAISGTPVHLAGALGVPTVVIRDDWFRRQWPVLTDRVPWYPSLRVVGKDGRDWGKVLDEARQRVLSAIAGPGR